MTIKPSAIIRNDYNEISEICKKSGEPIYLTKNGEGDLVVISIEAFERREKMLNLREELIRIEEERIFGNKGHSVEELDDLLTKIINKEEKNAQQEI